MVHRLKKAGGKSKIIMSFSRCWSWSWHLAFDTPGIVGIGFFCSGQRKGNNQKKINEI